MEREESKYQDDLYDYSQIEGKLKAENDDEGVMITAHILYRN